MEDFEKNSPKISENVDADNARLEDGTSNGGETIYNTKTQLMSMTSNDSNLDSNYIGKFSEDCEESTNMSPSLMEWKDVKIVVRFSKKKFPIEVALESSVQIFKGLIAQNCDVPIQQQLLIYKGCILKDDQTLQSYGMEANHAVYLICKSTPIDTNSGANRKIGGASSNDMGPLVIDVFEEELLEDEELQYRVLPSGLGSLANEPITQNLINILEIFRHLAMNHPELKEAMQQHQELAYIYNGPRDQSDHVVVSSKPNSTPLPNPWTTTITGWRGPRYVEGIDDERYRLKAGISTLTRLMHYPSIYHMIIDILSDPEALKQVPVAVNDDSYIESISLRETMQGLEKFNLYSSQQALPSEDSESESQDSGYQSEDDGDTGTLVNMRLEMVSNILSEVEAGSLIVSDVSNVPDSEIELSNATQILQPQETDTLNLEENASVISTSGNIVDAADYEVPEIVYAAQLSQLQEMGFLDTQENIRALIATLGNVCEAIERLRENTSSR